VRCEPVAVATAPLAPEPKPETEPPKPDAPKPLLAGAAEAPKPLLDGAAEAPKPVVVVPEPKPPAAPKAEPAGNRSEEGKRIEGRCKVMMMMKSYRTEMDGKSNMFLLHVLVLEPKPPKPPAAKLMLG
jgi:hypothetical protein